MSLSLNLAVGDTLMLDEGRVKLKLLKKSGRQVRIKIDAPEDMAVSMLNDYAVLRAQGLLSKAIKKPLPPRASGFDA